MNKLLKSMSTPRTFAATGDNTTTLQPISNDCDVNLRVDADTWNFFQKFSDDSRAIMAKVLKDYVETKR